MTRVNGVHHLAVATGDIKTQIEFFSDVLGMELVALYWMHGVEGSWHGFLRWHDTSYLAFVENPKIREIDTIMGVTHAGHGILPCAPGTMQHVAFNVDNDEELLNMRDRIRSRGINVVGPMEHGFANSIYFAGPENLTLEVSTSPEAIDAEAWIDPEVQGLAGISDEELARYKAPAAYEGQGGAVAQPPYDPAKPHVYGPVDEYRKTLEMSDADFTAKFSETTPPVKVAAE